jgi:hypothetical protein
LTREEVYRGVRGTMALYGGLFMKLVDTVGLEEAMAVHARLQEPYGDGLARLLTERLKGDEMNMEAFREVYISTSISGVENIYEMTSNSFRVLGHQCPVYDGLRCAGLDHDTVRLMCTGAAKLLMGAFGRHYPMIESGLTFRDKADGYCVEWYKLNSSKVY